MKKTKFSSYCDNNICTGCRFCVKGQKLVLFISGKCSRNCWYCSLSKKRKNVDLIWANERPIESSSDLIKEAQESRATSAGITGGDPLLFLSRTIKFSKALKNKFGKKFHIHIYLPTKLVNSSNIKKLSKYVDEFRLHPEFLINNSLADIEKIKLVSKIVGKRRLGIELPMIPDKKKEILEFILKVQSHISFVNLNEFELSETNIDSLKRYNLEEGGYVITGSKPAGLWLLRELEKRKVKISVHLCTAELKNLHQFKNRLKLHKTFPYGLRTKDGTVIYLAAYKKNNPHFDQLKKLKSVFYDKKKERIILSEKTARKLINNYKITRVEEFPTFDQIEVETEDIS